jgi:polyphosphate kinase
MAAAGSIAPVPSAGAPESLYFNRELSWLAFNRRVLEEACNPAHPLLERLRFLSISGDNLDEFFMVRVAGLKGQQLEGVEELSADGLTPSQQLVAIAREADALTASQQEVWTSLKAQLRQAGVTVLDVEEIGAAESTWLDRHFADHIYPVITPQAIDPAHPFPFIPNKGFSLIFDLRRNSDGEPIQELLMVPATLPRFIRLPGEGHRYVAIEALIRLQIAALFPGYTLTGGGAFRVIRDSDIEVEEEAEDLVRFFRSALKRRRRGRVIRLKLEADMPGHLVALVCDGLAAGDAFTHESTGFLGIGDLAVLLEADRPDLKFEPFAPRFPERIREYGGDCFAAIRAKDIIVHHPYESFDVVVAFLRQAADDPDVVAIKQTLYRAGKQSAVITALIAAAEAGKSVTAVIELKARFEEEQNLLWASALERAGVQVVYGFIEWKTHAKMSMVVRKEETGYRTYCHLGTGNYHPVTARTYTDLSYFTADPRVGRDVAHVFNYITGYIEPQGLELLSMSPQHLRRDIVAGIDAETANARAGKPAAIWAKLNSLVDPPLIDKLYEASGAGVDIELVVRGICCLRPGLPGVSVNIRVKSVVGRFLEHSRIWCFGNGAGLPSREAKVFISSADWMPRNFDRRIEYAAPLENETVHQQVLDQVMVATIIDNEQSWRLDGEGRYVRIKPGKREAPFNLHKHFMTNPSLSGRGAAIRTRGAGPRKLQLPPAD